MPEFPIEPEFGRFVAPIPDEEEQEIILPDMGEMMELEDGSVEFEPIEGEMAEEDFYENLAETLPQSVLDSLSTELLDYIDKDKKTREKRDKLYEEGIKRTGLGDDAPGGADFDGASRVVHPVLAEACVDFASRAIKELFPADGPVKTAIVGTVNDDKLDRAERKRKHMNWQLTKQCPEYRMELEQMLSQVGLAGSQFMKIWWEGNRPRFEFVPVDDLYLPYYSSGLLAATRYTHALKLNRIEFQKRINQGMYRDITNKSDPKDPDHTASKEATDKVEGAEDLGYNEDGVRTVYEVVVTTIIEDDSLAGGDFAPYVITIDESTEEVLAVYRNWKEEDESKKSRRWMVEFPFIPWRGAYSIGFIHLIGSIAAGATGALRALLDSAHINNLPGGIKLKGSRMSGQSVSINPTELAEVEGPPGVDDIRKVVMGLPFNPPSQVLYELLGFLTSAGKGVVQTASDKLDQVGDRTPVGTTMALIEQGSAVYSSIHARLHHAQAQVLDILADLNADNLDDDQTVEELDDMIISRDDYRRNNDITPVSDPHIFSEAQRYAQLQSVFQMAQDPQVKYDKNELHRRMLKLMRVPDVEGILPIPPKASKIDPITENVKSTKGEPIKAFEEQDHLAHMQAHMFFVTGPVVQGGQLMQAVAPLVAHTQEHLVMYYAQHAQAAAKAAEGLGAAMGEEAAGNTQLMVSQSMEEEIKPILEMLQQAKQMIPPPQPPMDAQAHVALMLGQKEIERKTQLDQATLNMKNQEQQLKQQMDGARLQMEQQAQEFKQFIEQMGQQIDAAAQQYAQQVELLKNEQDNHQHQMTELLKNRDDNETKMMIAHMQEQLKGIQTDMAEKPQQNQPEQQDLTPQLEQMNKLLGEIHQAKTNEALQSVMMGLQAVISEIGRPKRVVRDESGNLQGIE